MSRFNALYQGPESKYLKSPTETTQPRIAQFMLGFSRIDITGGKRTAAIGMTRVYSGTCLEPAFAGSPCFSFSSSHQDVRFKITLFVSGATARGAPECTLWIECGGKSRIKLYFINSCPPSRMCKKYADCINAVVSLGNAFFYKKETRVHVLTVYYAVVGAYKYRASKACLYGANCWRKDTCPLKHPSAAGTSLSGDALGDFLAAELLGLEL